MTYPNSPQDPLLASKLIPAHHSLANPAATNPAWPKRHYQGIIFDCDGTLVDSMPLHLLAWQATMQRYGIEFTAERFYELAGVPSDRIIRILAAEQSKELDAVSIAIEKEDAFLERLPLLRPIEPIMEVARLLREQVPVAVASGGYRRIIDQELAQVGCQDWFAAIVTAEDTQHHKPAPDVFLEAAARLGVPPETCLVYEDSDLGIQAAQAANMEWFDVRVLSIPRRTG